METVQQRKSSLSKRLRRSDKSFCFEKKPQFQTEIEKKNQIIEVPCTF